MFMIAARVCSFILSHDVWWYGGFGTDEYPDVLAKVEVNKSLRFFCRNENCCGRSRVSGFGGCYGSGGRTWKGNVEVCDGCVSVLVGYAGGIQK